MKIRVNQWLGRDVRFINKKCVAKVFVDVVFLASGTVPFAGETGKWGKRGRIAMRPYESLDASV